MALVFSFGSALHYTLRSKTLIVYIANDVLLKGDSTFKFYDPLNIEQRHLDTFVANFYHMGWHQISV